MIGVMLSVFHTIKENATMIESLTPVQRSNEGRRDTDTNIILLKPMDFEVCPETSEHVERLNKKMADNQLVGLVSISFSRDSNPIISISGVARHDPSLVIVECARLQHRILSHYDNV